jgi:hypothetical protein
MILYKLTDHTGYTRKGHTGETKWEVGQTVSIQPCINPELCSSQVIHAYKHANLALLLNPIHANLSRPLLWEADGDVCVEDWGKVGTFSLSVIRELEIPKWYAEDARIRQRIQLSFAILAARESLHLYEKEYPTDHRVRYAIESAERILRSPSPTGDSEAAHVARACAAFAQITSDTYPCAEAAAAEAAAEAACAAAYFARATRATRAEAAYFARAEAAYFARAAACAARAAVCAARAAVCAARAAVIDFGALADRAVINGSNLAPVSR